MTVDNKLDDTFEMGVIRAPQMPKGIEDALERMMTI